MKIVMNDKLRLLSQIAIGQVESKADALLSRYSDVIKSISITVKDLNGPRGGVDKECQVVVKLRKMQDVVTTARDVSLSKAVAASINRASRSVGRTVERRAVRAGSRHLGTALRLN